LHLATHCVNHGSNGHVTQATPADSMRVLQQAQYGQSNFL
jgi:hypothetical protein